MEQNLNFDKLKKQFARIGARLEVDVVKGEIRPPFSPYGFAQSTILEATPFSANVRTDRDGEHFTMFVGDNSHLPTDVAQLLHKLQVLDVQPKDRHLILQVVTGSLNNKRTEKLLMGHDERHWFIAGVKENVMTVKQAKDSLKPAEVLELQKLQKVKRSKRNKRNNQTFIRQGEWFFVPAQEFETNRLSIISRNEQLRRGRSKPHIAEEACRVGGTTVMVNSKFAPNGISMDEYNRLRTDDSQRMNIHRSGSWSALTRDARVYVRGKIRHPDHKTLNLHGWHRVHGNMEPRMQTVAFLD